MFRRGEEPARPGVVAGEGVVPVAARSVQEILAEGREGLERAATQARRAGAGRVSLGEVRLEVPVRPAVVVAPGPRPDPSHGERLARHREFYIKSAHTVIPTSGPVPYRAALGGLSYRAQVGLVLGPTPRRAAASSVLDGLLGAVLAAEVYSVDLLRVGWEGTMWHVRYGEGASFDGTCPVGPFLVTADEFDLEGLPLEDAAESAKLRREDVAGFASYVSGWMALGTETLLLAGSAHGPVLSVEGADPLIRFPEGEPGLGPGDRVTARSEPLGEIDAGIGEGR